MDVLADILALAGYEEVLPAILSIRRITLTYSILQLIVIEDNLLCLFI